MVTKLSSPLTRKFDYLLFVLRFSWMNFSLPIFSFLHLLTVPAHTPDPVPLGTACSLLRAGSGRRTLSHPLIAKTGLCPIAESDVPAHALAVAAKKWSGNAVQCTESTRSDDRAAPPRWPNPLIRHSEDIYVHASKRRERVLMRDHWSDSLLPSLFFFCIRLDIRQFPLATKHASPETHRVFCDRGMERQKRGGPHHGRDVAIERLLGILLELFAMPDKGHNLKLAEQKQEKVSS